MKMSFWKRQYLFLIKTQQIPTYKPPRWLSAGPLRSCRRGGLGTQCWTSLINSTFLPSDPSCLIASHQKGSVSFFPASFQRVESGLNPRTCVELKSVTTRILTSPHEPSSGYIVAITEWTENPTMTKARLMNTNEVRDWTLQEGC